MDQESDTRQAVIIAGIPKICSTCWHPMDKRVLGINPAQPVPHGPLPIIYACPRCGHTETP